MRARVQKSAIRILTHIRLHGLRYARESHLGWLRPAPLAHPLHNVPSFSVAVGEADVHGRQTTFCQARNRNR